MGQGFQLGDGETIGKGGQDHGVGLPVELAHLGTGHRAQPADVWGCGPGLRIEFARAGKGELHRLGLENPHGLEQAGDALAQADGAQEEQLKGAARRGGVRWVGLELGGRALR